MHRDDEGQLLSEGFFCIVFLSDCIKLIRSDHKDIYNVARDHYFK